MYLSPFSLTASRDVGCPALSLQSVGYRVEWYELSSQGRSIGTPTEFDFYMEIEGKSPVGATEANKKELAEV